ncbi:hypothetical protein DCAR_0103703 [Daucus carota subsp. sativus]|uniref:F-box domain-containing protein n=2 Tax=Daucus carota subsp. sativus TaxID=79200 RepID=A0AAF0W8R3_DAUCS|nr:PREDICTED: F-box/kelch-repeat protein At3g06240-like [Daucus carota subsp. sativus]WOG84519.1 hypothetical protein DCAR_0103703 [Daucus carota subsp. sativus]
MSGARNIDLLPPEMITEIFTCLPAKSLGLCKCVSKSWNSFISHPSFIKAHLAKTSITKLLLIDNGYGSSLFSVSYANNNLDAIATKSSFRTSQYFINVWTKVWGSCNGLILLENNRGVRFLLNPTTLKFRRLPRQYGGYYNKMLGFGYDSSSDDHVIVLISCLLSDKSNAYVFVYELKGNIWKSVQVSPYDHSLIRLVPGIFFKGYLHWFAKDGKDGLLLIAAFDLAKKGFSRVALPDGIVDLKTEFLSIQVLHGCLCVIAEYNSKTELWIMKEYGVVESWIKLAVDVSEGSWLVSTHLEEDSLLMLKGSQFLLLVSNTEEAKLQPVNVLGLPSGFKIGMSYVDSLFSPRREDWKIKKTRRRSKNKTEAGMKNYNV